MVLFWTNFFTKKRKPVTRLCHEDLSTPLSNLLGSSMIRLMPWLTLNHCDLLCKPVSTCKYHLVWNKQMKTLVIFFTCACLCKSCSRSYLEFLIDDSDWILGFVVVVEIQNLDFQIEIFDIVDRKRLGKSNLKKFKIKQDRSTVVSNECQPLMLE